MKKYQPIFSNQINNNETGHSITTVEVLFYTE